MISSNVAVPGTALVLSIEEIGRFLNLTCMNKEGKSGGTIPLFLYCTQSLVLYGKSKWMIVRDIGCIVTQLHFGNGVVPLAIRILISVIVYAGYLEQGCDGKTLLGL